MTNTIAQEAWNPENDTRFGNMLRIARCRHALANYVLDERDRLMYTQEMTTSYSKLNEEDQSYVDKVHAYPFTLPNPKPKASYN